ncbi:MAG: hypothetical protein FWG91_11220 [Lachnospiraceae bacterium]|nr:hypothetical protein [Lachnospiraceae bacterium]
MKITKKLSAIVITLISLAMLSACGQETPADILEYPIDLILEVEVEVADGFAFTSIRSNLPNGISLMATVVGDNYIGQDSEELSGGMALPGPFSSGGDPLPPGDYTIRITTGVSEVLTEEIRAAIGDNYSNYRGEYFKENDIGQRSISYLTSFKVDVGGDIP